MLDWPCSSFSECNGITSPCRLWTQIIKWIVNYYVYTWACAEQLWALVVVHCSPLPIWLQLCRQAVRGLCLPVSATKTWLQRRRCAKGLGLLLSNLQKNTFCRNTTHKVQIRDGKSIFIVSVLQGIMFSESMIILSMHVMMYCKYF